MMNLFNSSDFLSESEYPMDYIVEIELSSPYRFIYLHKLDQFLSPRDISTLRLASKMTGTIYNSIENMSNMKCPCENQNFITRANKEIDSLLFFPIVITEIITGYLSEALHFDFLDPAIINESTADKILSESASNHLEVCEKFQFQYLLILANLTAFLVINDKKNIEGKKI